MAHRWLFYGEECPGEALHAITPDEHICNVPCNKGDCECGNTSMCMYRIARSCHVWSGLTLASVACRLPEGAVDFGGHRRRRRSVRRVVLALDLARRRCRRRLLLALGADYPVGRGCQETPERDCLHGRARCGGVPVRRGRLPRRLHLHALLWRSVQACLVHMKLYIVL